MTPARHLRRTLLIAIAIAAAAFTFVAGAPTVARAADGPAEIAAAPALEWGFKVSWRLYAPAPEVSDGAAVTAPSGGSDAYGLSWAFDSGSFDASTGTTVLRYRGTVHWEKYRPSEMMPPWPAPPGYDGPPDPYILDVTLADPIVTIGPEGSTISVTAKSRDQATWQIVDYGRVDVVSLDPTGITPTAADGTTSWSAIPAAVTADGTRAFGGNYQPGVAVDSVSFSYSGPGGAPDLSDHFDAPGSLELGSVTNQILLNSAADGQNFEVWWVDRVHRIAHVRYGTGGPDWTYRAFDLDTMRYIGEPLIVPSSEQVTPTNAYDPDSGRLYYQWPNEADTRRWIGFDRALGRYVLGVLDHPLPNGRTASLNWDPFGDRAFEIRLHAPAGVGPDDYDNHEWQLRTFKQRTDGTWAISTHVLPSFPPGFNAYGYSVVSSIAAPTAVAVADGVFVIAGVGLYNVADGSFPETMTGAWRVELGDNDAAAEPVTGTTAIPNFEPYTKIQPGPDGQLTLSKQEAGVRVQNLHVTADGQVRADEPVEIADSDSFASQPDAIAVDPTDGTVWIGGWQSRRLWAVRDGRVVLNQLVPERHPRGGIVAVGPDHTVYTQTNDGSDAAVGGSAVYGIGKLARIGVTATVSAQPQDASVSLAGGDASRPASFTAAATGAQPVPTLRWQAKAPGSARFADIPGQTDQTLTVDARPGMDGTQYRAVFTNAAGRVASEPATLTVRYAPRIAFEPLDVRVVAGSPASFELLASGDPEPAITWQRRVDGFWRDIGPADDDFVVDGGRLTVSDTVVEQSGAQFRARISNDLATIYSRTARLTVDGVTPPSSEPLVLGGVVLDWTGSEEFQARPPSGDGSNFLSAGVSDGSQGTYSATAGKVAVYQVSAAGVEVPATWATRGAHVGSGGHQLVRLSDGRATVRPDGSATVSWTGAFTANFYEGMLPFTITNPVLNVTAGGTGTLTAGQLSGYKSSQANPGHRVALAPVSNVVFATFSGVRIDPAGKVTVTPDYAGVEVTIPPTPGILPQDRTSPGWGAWPQPFVDFQLQTGLSSYWYSSGGVADPKKPPAPFVVDFTHAGPPVDEPPTSGGGQTTPSAGGGGGGGPSQQPASAQPTGPVNAPAPAPQASPSVQSVKRPVVSAHVARQRVGGGGIATVAQVVCGSQACRVTAPETVRVRIAGKVYRARVAVSKAARAGGKVAVRLRLPKAAVRQLAGRQVRVDVRLAVTAGNSKTSRTATVTITGAKKTGAQNTKGGR